ncbi:hypothetical protein BVY04_01420, partial [bacterium M21]
LLTLEESQALINARQTERESLLISERTQRDLEKELNELEREMDEDEKELLEKHRIKELIEKVKATPDPKEAMRQMAALEKELKRISDNLSTRQDERFLSDVGKNLSKSKETRKLANKLAQKKYKEAANELKKMKLNPNAKSKAIKEGMKGLSSLNRGLRKATKAGSPDSSMKADASELSKEIEELEKINESACKQCKSCGECDKKTGDKQCKSCKSCNNKLGRLSDKMARLGARKKFLSDLEKIRKRCSSCQSMMAGQCSGKQAGSGTDNRTRENAVTPSTGQMTKLTGIKGEGKSQAWVEDAESGNGVSQVPTAARSNRLGKSSGDSMLDECADR